LSGSTVPKLAVHGHRLGLEQQLAAAGTELDRLGPVQAQAGLDLVGAVGHDQLVDEAADLAGVA
jgi:hypothetical protein